MTAEVSFKISRGVFFDTVGNEVYLRNVDTHRDYLFNESRVDPDCLNVPTDTCMLAYAQYHCMEKI